MNVSGAHRMVLEGNNPLTQQITTITASKPNNYRLKMRRHQGDQVLPHHHPRLPIRANNNNMQDLPGLRQGVEFTTYEKRIWHLFPLTRE